MARTLASGAVWYAVDPISLTCPYVVHSLQGTTITLSTKTNVRYEGTVASTSGEGDTTGVTLRDVKELSSPGAPLKDQLFIAATNIDQWTSGPADARTPAQNGDSECRVVHFIWVLFGSGCQRWSTSACHSMDCSWVLRHTTDDRVYLNAQASRPTPISAKPD